MTLIIERRIIRFTKIHILSKAIFKYFKFIKINLIRLLLVDSKLFIRTR